MLQRIRQTKTVINNSQCCYPAASSSSTAPAATTPPAVLNTGDTAWMIVATALVMLNDDNRVLALFYGGIAKEKRHSNVIAMSFVTFCIVSVL